MDAPAALSDTGARAWGSTPQSCECARVHAHRDAEDGP